MAEKVVVRTTPKTAVKPAAKALAKNASKAFDVSRPGKSAAVPTSKPVIVGNRPIMQDPMMLSDAMVAQSVTKANPMAAKVKIQPLSAAEKKDAGADSKKTDKAADLPTAIKLADDTRDDDGSKPSGIVTKTALVEPPVAAERVEDKPTGAPPVEIGLMDKQKDWAVADTTEPKADEPADAKEAAKAETRVEEPASEKESANAKLSDKPDEAGKPAPGSKDSKTPAESVPEAATDSEADSPSAVETNAGEAGVNEKAAAELEAAAKKQSALDELVENKTYFLPINSVEKRRSTIISALGVVLIIVLGLFLVNLLMDVGTLEINGVKPLTHFFGS